jgi:hypothetical protein
VKRIIVEGADGTGKTTLIEFLMSQFHFLRLVINPLGPEQNFNHWWPAEMHRREPPLIPIYDRFYYSELVYGPALRGYVNASSGIVHEVGDELRLSALLIYCKTESPVLTSNEQMEGVYDNHVKIERAYEQLMSVERNFYPAGRFYVYDWTEPNALHRVEALVERYLDLHLYDRRPSSSSTGSGS